MAMAHRIGCPLGVVRGDIFERTYYCKSVDPRVGKLVEGQVRRVHRPTPPPARARAERLP